MKKKTIGMDLDETLMNIVSITTPIFKKHNIDFIPLSDLSLNCYPQKIKEDIVQALKTPEILCSLPMYPKVEETLKKLRDEKGYSLILISGRYDEVKEQTIKWINSILPYFDKIYITPPGLTGKLDLIQENEIDLWIDDNPHEIEELIDKIPCVMISNENTVYNHSYRDRFDHVEYFYQVEPEKYLKD